MVVPGGRGGPACRSSLGVSETHDTLALLLVGRAA